MSVHQDPMLVDHVEDQLSKIIQSASNSRSVHGCDVYELGRIISTCEEVKRNYKEGQYIEIDNALQSWKSRIDKCIDQKGNCSIKILPSSSKYAVLGPGNALPNNIWSYSDYVIYANNCKFPSFLCSDWFFVKPTPEETTIFTKYGFTYEILLEDRDVFVYPRLGLPVEPIDPEQDFEFFQLEDAEYRIHDRFGLNFYQYGRNMKGESVLIRSHGFHPHFSIKMPKTWNFHHVETFKDALEETMRKVLKESKDAKRFSRLVVSLTPYMGRDLMGYHGEEPEKFIQIQLAYPKFVKDCRMLLEYPRGKGKGKFSKSIPDWWPLEVPPLITDPKREFPTYESNMAFVLRFEVDHKIRATGWVKVRAKQYSVIPHGDPIRSSSCDHEIACHHSAVGYSQTPSIVVPPFKVYGLDIECTTPEDGSFPKATSVKDPDGSVIQEGQPMIQVGFKKVFVTGKQDETSQGIHMIGSTRLIPEAQEIYTYTTEGNLVRGLHDDITVSDPDFVVHYNGNNFDMPYIIDRSKETGMYEFFGDFGRLKGLRSRYYNTSFNTSAHKTEQLQTTLYGRTNIDVMQCLKRGKKLRTYGLNAVAKMFLDKGKVEMDYHLINFLQKTPEGRKTLAYYCMIDASLPWDLAVHLKLITNYIQTAYVAGVSVNKLLNGGQQQRMLAQVYHYAKDTQANPIPDFPDPNNPDVSKRRDYPFVVPVFPTYWQWMSDKYAGAVVVDPITGYHEKPVTTLDFSSLYPSIIIAHNLCWTTYVDEYTIKLYNLVEGKHYKRMLDVKVHPDGRVEDVVNPANPCFLLPSFKKGVLPSILETLLAKRKEVRGKAEGVVDKTLLAIIDGLQLGFKEMANSMYGATGTEGKGYLPCRPIAESVTREGRRMILTVGYAVTQKYNKKNGYPFNAKIIYGDTDSVFVLFDEPEAPLKLPDGQLWEKELGGGIKFSSDCDFDYVRDVSLEMANYVSGFFLKPISMAYEKSFNGIILVNKKRYAGLKVVWGVDNDASWATGYKKPVYNPDGSLNEKESKKGWWAKTVYKVDLGQSKFSATGLECVRRDSCILVSEMVSKVLKTVIVQKNVVGAVKYARDEISKLLLGKQPYSKLIITRALSRKPQDYKTKAAHVNLAVRMQERDPGSAPKMGDRVQYVVVPGAQGQKASELGENPFYAFENNILPDYNWYLENQLKKPLRRIFFYVFKNPEIVKQVAELEKEADWVKHRHIFDGDMTDADLFDEDEAEEDKEDEEARQREFEEDFDPEVDELTDLMEVLGGDPLDIMDVEQKTEEKTPEPSQKRKHDSILSFFGVPQAKPTTVTLAGKVSVAKERDFKKKREKKEHDRKRKEKEQKMEKCIGNSIIFSGSHMQRVVKTVSTATGAASFFTKMTNCQICGLSTKSTRKAVCDTCLKDKETVKKAENQNLEDLETNCKTLVACLKKCEDCVKKNPSIGFDTCKNTDCDILWDRMIAYRSICNSEEIKRLDW